MLFRSAEGRNDGLNFSLAVAIAIARREVALAHGPDQQGMALNDLGVALEELGERESGVEKLKEAVAAYRAALEERTRERAPLAWATSSGDQGIALMQLAERTKKAEMAETGFRQIETALQIMRTGGHAPLAAHFEARLPEARRIRDALNVP